MRKICVFTSTRADFGLLSNLLEEIRVCPGLQLQLLVSGTHLDANQGMTLTEIQQANFEPAQCVPIDLDDDSPAGICQAMGTAMARYGRFFSEFSPDLLMVLGDRFETLCCAAAAHVSGLPIAHIHGGETTQGTIDEAFRHSITKMAQIHFSSSEEHKNRIIQLGEQPQMVHNVGSLGAENIGKLEFLDRTTLEKSINFKLDKPFFLITYHPVTLEQTDSLRHLSELFGALEKYLGYKSIFTQANADPEGRRMNQILKDYQQSNPDRCIVTPSLGYRRYLSAMRLSAVVVGNSSSGLLEAPVLNIPTVNIGDRQKGRVKAPGVIDCQPERADIAKALKRALSSVFRSKLKDCGVLSDSLGTAREILKIVTTTNLDGILKKKFYDLPFS